MCSKMMNHGLFSDESELEFSGSSQAELWRFRAEPGHSNFRAETELIIRKQIFQISQFCFCIMISINFMIFFWIYVAQKVHNLDIFRTSLL